MFRGFRPTQRGLALTGALLATTASASYWVLSPSANAIPPEQRHTRSPAKPFSRSPFYDDAGTPGASALAEKGRYQNPHSLWTPPSRKDVIKRLKGLDKNGQPIVTEAGEDEEFDLLIVGGGATGAGCALDAVTRGLKVALVERDDFAAGTSSRSTKLVHGGVRYLEKAFWDLDYEQFKLVMEALHERGVFLKIAPYLSYQLPIMLPVYQYWKLPYYWIGTKVYDFLAGSENLSPSYFMSKSKALENFPMLDKEKIVGALAYYDGAHNDSRMNVTIALTAVAHGAAVANHVEVTGLLKRTDPAKPHEPAKIYAAAVRDRLTGDTWNIRCKGVINATGPFTDGLRQMDDNQAREIVSPSMGVHIILPGYYSPRHMGLVDPSTSDGRVIFFLPWQGNTIVGTTDTPTHVSSTPYPTEAEISWILGEVKNYLSPELKVRRGDVLAAWAGIRPLIRDPRAKNTAALVRNHMVDCRDSGLITVAGGKWTTYRAMAKDTIDAAVTHLGLKPERECCTENVLLLGSAGWYKNMYIRLIQHFGLETEVAQHLSDSYGDRAWAVASLASLTGRRWPVLGKRLAVGYPYIEAEVRYACQREYACKVVDVIARRTRLAFLNAQAANDTLPRVIEIMAEELGWDKERCQQEAREARQFLTSMGLHTFSHIDHPIAGFDADQTDAASTAAAFVSKTIVVPTDIEDDGPLGVMPIPRTELAMYERSRDLDIASNPSTEEATFFSRSHFTSDELSRFTAAFKSRDVDNDGHIRESDLIAVLAELDVKLPASELPRLLAQVELERSPTNSNAIELNDFLEIMATVKEMKSKRRIEAFVSRREQEREKVAGHEPRHDDVARGREYPHHVNDPERSGGGV